MATVINNENYLNTTVHQASYTNIMIVKEKLKKYFPEEDKLQKFFELLKSNQALVAGGFILNLITRSDNFITDLDIYVPSKNIVNFINGISDLYEPIIFHRIRESSKYCSSFLRKNGIRRVYTFDHRTLGNMIDIMSVRNKKTPLEVVNNFDLTFCQTWFDGENVYASHPEDIKTRKGTLQKDYVASYVKGNRFLRKRIQKYTIFRPDEAKFTVKLDTSLLDSFTIDRNPSGMFCSKNDINFEQWFVSNLMSFIINKYKSNSGVSNPGRENVDTVFSNDQYTPNKTDEYDSDDYEIDSEPIKEFANANYLEGNTTLSKDEKYAHANHDYFYALVKTLSLGNEDKAPFRENRFFEFTKDHVKRQGQCFVLTTDEDVWDFHEHTLNQGISEEGLEMYLTSIMDAPDKKNIKCYIPECEKNLQHHEIKGLVTEEFFERFMEPKDVSAKLNIAQPMDWILKNIQSTTDGWGDVYHDTICPFCLAPEKREEGCAYMSHQTNSKLKSPYCQKYNIIPEIFNKYDSLCNYRLEFCITCGRPCCDHKHFDLDLENPRLLDTILVAGVNAPDSRYTKCMGGGRPELFARLLAIQKVINEQEFENDFEQRKACALAALAAPLNEELMAKGREIFAKTPESRELANIGYVAPVKAESEENEENEESNNNSVNSEASVIEQWPPGGPPAPPPVPEGPGPEGPVPEGPVPEGPVPEGPGPGAEGGRRITKKKNIILKQKFNKTRTSKHLNTRRTK